jgi:hypothetical protein
MSIPRAHLVHVYLKIAGTKIKTLKAMGLKQLGKKWLSRFKHLKR